MLQSNEYFSGKVKSIGFTSSCTGRASVGVMAEGEYTFGTAAPEEMTVVSGALNVLLPGETEWKVYAAGDVRTKELRQVVTAVADGAMAAHYAEKYLAEG